MGTKAKQKLNMQIHTSDQLTAKKIIMTYFISDFLTGIADLT